MPAVLLARTILPSNTRKPVSRTRLSLSAWPREATDLDGVVPGVVLASAYATPRNPHHAAVYTDADIEDIRQRCLEDTGAGVSLVPPSLVKSQTIIQGNAMRLETASGQPIVYGTVTLSI